MTIKSLLSPKEDTMLKNMKQTDKTKDKIKIHMLCFAVVLSLLIVGGVLYWMAGSLASTLKQLELETGAYDELERYLHILSRVIIPLMTVVVLATIAVCVRMTFILRMYVKEIENNENISERGVYELRYLARVYNAQNRLQQQKTQHLQLQVDIDNMTGAVSRAAFEQMIDTVLHEHGEKGAFLLIDVDRFKQINDTYGHDMGDHILQSVVEVLQASFRSCDIVARLGGDEFAVWLSELNEDSTDYIRKRIAVINNRLLHPTEQLPPVTLSVGVSFGRAEDDFKSLYKSADSALYRVKEGGRCGCEFFS